MTETGHQAPPKPWECPRCHSLFTLGPGYVHEPCATDQANRRTELVRMTKTKLIVMYRLGITAPDGGKVSFLGGMYPIEQWAKSEIISSILGIEFPSQTS